jgi:hypothetical protein
MKALRSSLLLAALLALLTSCKRDAPGSTATAAPKDAPSAVPTEEHHHHEKNLPPVDPSVKVGLDGKSVEVALASVPADGGSISFAALWKAAYPKEDPAKLHFELVGSDGFRPSSRSKCTRLLTGAELSSARLNVTTHDLSIDESTGLPGCYRVRAVVAVEATR